MSIHSDILTESWLTVAIGYLFNLNHDAHISSFFGRVFVKDLAELTLSN